MSAAAIALLNARPDRHWLSQHRSSTPLSCSRTGDAGGNAASRPLPFPDRKPQLYAPPRADDGQYELVVVSPRSYFLYTPLLPSAAAGSVSERSIMEPIRNLLQGQVRGWALVWFPALLASQ